MLVQRLAPDEVRGRAFAFEMAIHTVTACAAPILAAALLDAGFAPGKVMATFAGITFVFGAAWTFAARRAAPR